MKAVNRELDINELRDAFTYKNGQLIWKNCDSKYFNNKIAGNLAKNGYITITYKQQQYLAHRLIWLYKFGKWPDDQIDHINGIKTDNRIENLRLATNAQNGQNKRVYSHNTTGSKVSGVSYCTQKKKYKVTLVKDGRWIHGGFFDSVSDAEIRSDEMRQQYYSHYISQL